MIGAVKVCLGCAKFSFKFGDFGPPPPFLINPNPPFGLNDVLLFFILFELFKLLGISLFVLLFWLLDILFRFSNVFVFEDVAFINFDKSSSFVDDLLSLLSFIFFSILFDDFD